MPKNWSDAEVARVCHEAIRAMQVVLGDQAPDVPWDAKRPEYAEGVVRAVRMYREGASREQVHEAWCTDRKAMGWTWGPEKDWEKMTHPCLVPWDDLPDEQKRKDAVFSANVMALTV